MSTILTVAACAACGFGTRILALGLCGKPFTDGPAMTTAWTLGWGALGWSFVDWKSRQEKLYLERLQHLIDRKDRRDKWDAIYFGSMESASSAKHY